MTIKALNHFRKRMFHPVDTVKGVSKHLTLITPNYIFILRGGGTYSYLYLDSGAVAQTAAKYKT